VSARSVLVVAPHYDDEVLGCGGLIRQLATSGAVVRVLFASDGGADAEGAERTAYAARRLDEARAAAAVLGVAGLDTLGLPDGRLASHIEDLAQGLRRAGQTQRPDLLLVPSPLEVTADHRAVFAAVHAVYSPLRGQELEEMGSPVFLLYEVNHPQYPDLLVDVGAELPLLEQAMACYASQEELHPYLNAARGLRSFRALSLPPDTRAAEGYRRLELADLGTRGLSALVAHLGGVPEQLVVEDGPLVSVVVRTRDRPQLLEQALRSLDRGSYRRVEVVLVNDGGAPPVPPADFGLRIEHVALPESRGRAAAANAGLAAATGEFIAFLDDDDLAEPEHLATLVGLTRAAQVRVAYTDAAVGIYELDGASGWREAERRLPYSRDFDPDRLLVDNYIPFNTLIIERPLALAAGPFDESLPFFEDWDFLIRLSQLTDFHHRAQVTCEYRHFRSGSHHVFGERPRERADFLATKARVIEKHLDRLSPAHLAAVVDELRAEAVEANEARGAAQAEAREAREAETRLAAELGALRREWFDLEARFHRLNGEAEALRGDRERQRREIERLGEESSGHQRDAGALREEMARRDGDLQRLYDDEAALRREVGRLLDLVRAMEGTRAWRAHSWWQRRFGPGRG
jgi:LmbE family N-acetylglucosaminyl deacetylase